jgi:hypothetical protein
VNIVNTGFDTVLLKPGQEKFFSWKREWTKGVDILGIKMDPAVSLEWKIIDGDTKKVLDDNITPRGWLTAFLEYGGVKTPILVVKNASDEHVAVSPEVWSFYEPGILEALGALFR